MRGVVDDWLEPSASDRALLARLVDDLSGEGVAALLGVALLLRD
jgi:hypothetical protein